jgi:hypothetical protein
VKKLPLFAVALVAAIPAFWFVWIVVGGPMWDGNYGTYQVEVFKNKAVLVLLILTLIVCALIAFMPFLALIFGGEESVALATPGGGGGTTDVDADPETDEIVDDDPFVDDGDDGDDDPFADDEDEDDDDDPFADDDESDDESDGELDIEGLDENDIFDEDDEDDEDVFAFDDE